MYTASTRYAVYRMGSRYAVAVHRIPARRARYAVRDWARLEFQFILQPILHFHFFESCPPPKQFCNPQLQKVGLIILEEEF